MQRAKRLYPIILAIAAQAVAALVLVGIIQLLWREFSYDISLTAKLALQSCLAAGLSYIFRLPRWWLWIQAGLPFAFYVLIIAGLPAWTYLLVFVLLLLFYWNSADDRVPLYLTNSDTAEVLTREILTKQAGDAHDRSFMDMGCGPAGLLLQLARKNPDWTFVGIETAPLLWLTAVLRAKLSGLGNIKIYRRDIWKADISNTDILYCFLSPAPMKALYEKFCAEASQGTILASNSFTIPDVSPDREIKVTDKRQTILYLWQADQK